MRFSKGDKHTCSVLVALALALPLTNGAAVTPRVNTWSKRNVPNKIEACAPESHMRFQPAMDFDRDGCYNTPAIDAEGYLNPGIKLGVSPAFEGGCRDEIDLRNNSVYSRVRCNNGWCGYMYGYYFEKDQTLTGGHLHDWEFVVVWTQDDQPKYVSASAHGEYNLRWWDDVRKDGGTHPKIVYHKDGASTHAMRFGNDGDEPPENHDQAWFYGDLVGWLGFPSPEIRDKMANYNWDKAKVDINESRFAEALKKAATVAQAGRPPAPITGGFDFETDGIEAPVLGCGFYPRR